MKRVSSILMMLMIVSIASTVSADEPELMRLWLPGNDWAVEIDLQGILIDNQSITPDCRGRSLNGTDTNQQLIVSVFLEPAESLSAAEFRDSSFDYLKALPMKFKDVRTYETAEAAFISYNVIEIKDVKGFTQRNEFVYLVQDSTWINVHISCMNPEAEHDANIDRLLNSIKIVAPYQSTSFDYFIFGSWFYRQNDLKQAANYYEQALALEKIERLLPIEYWLVLIDNLGMAYGISGDGENARRVFEYGLSVEPEYPMFYYNLACCNAEEGKPEAALKQLAKAYEYEANRISGEGNLPDPLADASFKRYWNDEKFIALVLSNYKPEVKHLWMPGNNWAFEIDLKGLLIPIWQVRTDLRGRFIHAADSMNKTIVQIHLEPVPIGETVLQYRELSKGDIDDLSDEYKDLMIYEEGQLAYLEYHLVGSRAGREFDERNSYAYIVRDTIGMRVHISCMNPIAGDNMRVERILKSLKVFEDYETKAIDYLAFASRCYLENNYESAIGFYEQALAMEREERVLHLEYWLVLIDNLGMSYGLTGDWKNAREILEYGISVEPEYPMFYWNLSCCYAEAGDLDTALEILAKAFEFEANGIPGEGGLPDPYQDDSFKRYWKNEKFKEFISSMSK